MNREALQQLERVVRDATDDLFCMHTFEAKTHCGTVRCAAGWASSDAWFKTNAPIFHNAGLFEEMLPRIFGLSREDSDALFGANLDGSPYDRQTGMLRLFTVTKLAVIANIHRLLRGNPAIPYAATKE